MGGWRSAHTGTHTQAHTHTYTRMHVSFALMLIPGALGTREEHQLVCLHVCVLCVYVCVRALATIRCTAPVLCVRACVCCVRMCVCALVLKHTARAHFSNTSARARAKKQLLGAQSLSCSLKQDLEKVISWDLQEVQDFYADL